MPDQMSSLYGDLLNGSYDCVDRIILNAYFGMGQTGGGFRTWWRSLYGSDAKLNDTHLMRMAGRRQSWQHLQYRFAGFQFLRMGR